MRHNIRNRVFGRSHSERKALLNSLARAVLISERINTTAQKAKEAVKAVDKLITLGKKNDINSRRLAYKILQDRDLVKLLFNEVAPRFQNRNGGYTRIILSGFRKGDGAQMAILELVERKPKEVKKKPKKTEEAKKAKEKAKKPEDKAEVPKKEEKHEVAPPVKEHHREAKREPKKKFLGGIRKLFKKERDSL